MEKVFAKGWMPVRRSDEDSSSQDGLLADNGNGNDEATITKPRSKWRKCSPCFLLTVVNIAICITTLTSITLLNRHQFESRFPEDKLIFPTLNMSPPTPRSRFWTNESTSIYIQPPSPAVDAAWDTLSLENLEMTTITASQALALGRDPSLLSRVPTSWGLGPDLFFAQIGVFHLIHCLDEIRKQMHYDHYHLEMFGRDPPEEFKNHKNHCVHVLLENLLCQASTDVVTHNWREGYSVPLADFHPEGRQCRNFDGLWEAAKERAIRDYRTEWRKLTPPVGARILPAPTPRLYPPGGHHHDG